MPPLASRQPVAPSAETLAGLAAVQPLKRQAFEVWSPGQTWFAWCSATGTAITMDDAIWTAWNGSGLSTATGSLAYNYTSNIAYVSNGTTWIAWNAGYQETEDERLERERRAAEEAGLRQARWAEREREQEQVKARSLALLKSLLTPAQWQSYQQKGWFEVRGSSGRRWRIRDRGQSGNVDLMPEAGEERDATYCAHPPGGLPAADAHAAQMLALVTDDEAFVRVANRHYIRPGLRELRSVA